MTDHGAFYPQAFYNDLLFELTLAPASQVVRGPDTSKLVYKLTNIQLEYEVIRSKQLADEATSFYTHGKEFAYDLVVLEEVVEVKSPAQITEGHSSAIHRAPQQALGTLKTTLIQTLPK